jgi:hypothetical protein
MIDLAPPLTPILVPVTSAGDVLDGLELDVTEASTLDSLGIDFARIGEQMSAGGGPSLLLVAALGWLHARRSTHPGITWEIAEPLIKISLV